jgi:hypothetical protein
MKTIGLVASLTGVAIASAVASALLTPDGAVTRGKISRFFKDLSGKLPDGIQDYLGLKHATAVTTNNLSRAGVRSTALHS